MRSRFTADSIAAVSSRVRSYMASTNGVDQWAEWRAIRESRPALIFATIDWPTSGAISPLRTWPHQIKT